MLDVTIVVVPRESFSLFPAVVEQIYAATSADFKMIVMEGNSPPPIRSRLLELSESFPNCSVVLSDEWRYPHEIVNEALGLIETEFALFVDNDIEVTSGAVELLKQCAIDNNASCVHPLYLERVADKPLPRIHVADGRIIRETRDGENYLEATMSGKAQAVADYPLVSPTASDFFEWHCVLLRKSLIDRIGPLRPLTINAHLDYSLEITALGEAILMEPRARVIYDKSRLPELTGPDREFLLYRWNLEEAAVSMKLFRERWDLAENATDFKMNWARKRYQGLLDEYQAAASN